MIDLIAGARPNFVKIAALIHANSLLDSEIQFRLIHTGQHYDETLSGSFFRDLALPPPDINLGVGSGSQAEQTALIMIRYEEILLKERPEMCIVVGDVTSSMACAITAKKMQVRVAHIEAGIRSNDWSMHEEVNRTIIDSIADYFFTTTQNASLNLIKMGIENDKIHFVGNTMIDTLLRFRSLFQQPKIWEELCLEEQKYIMLTLHRPGNVDEAQRLNKTLNEILFHSRNLPVIFPVHPRTAKIVNTLKSAHPNLHIIEPLNYLQFNFLIERAKAVITDSGGITEETTILGVPCMTLRDNTERPETITIGTNELLGTDPNAIGFALKKLFEDQWKSGGIPEMWDGKTGERILKLIKKVI